MPSVAVRRLAPISCVLGLAAVGLTAGPVAAADSRTTSAPPFSWSLVDTGSTGSFRGLDAVDGNTAWVSSDSGEVLRTVDGGATFTDVAPAEGAADGLAFRDVEARSADEALVLSIGEGDASRIYRTSDAGVSWDEVFRNDEPAAFYDCMSMSDRKHGLAMSDPVDGKFRVITTSDGGRSWDVVPDEAMPDALEGEFAFAASGTCVTTAGDHAWFATGGAEARVFRSSDRGQTWEVSSTPILSSDGGGIFSLDFRTPRLGIAIGGDFNFPDEATDALARTTDGGVTWTLVDESKAPAGYRSGSAWWSDRRGDTKSEIEPAQRTVFAVGPTGSDVSQDRGRTWASFDSGAFHSVECVKRSTACWASGPEGRVATLAVG